MQCHQVVGILIIELEVEEGAHPHDYRTHQVGSSFISPQGWLIESVLC